MDINWDDVYNKRIKVPFLPSVKSATDLSNFDTEFTSEEPVLTPCNQSLTRANQEEFRGFTYISDWAIASRNAAAADDLK